MPNSIVSVSIKYGPNSTPPRLCLEYGPLRYKVVQAIGGWFCNITRHRFCNTNAMIYLECYGSQHTDVFEIAVTDEQILEFKEVAGWNIGAYDEDP